MGDPNFSRPDYDASTYANLCQEIRDLARCLAVMFNGETASNIPNNAIRWNATDKRFEITADGGSTWATLPVNIVANDAALGTGGTDGELRITLDNGNVYTWDDGNSKWRIRSGNTYAGEPSAVTYTVGTGTRVFDSTAGVWKEYSGAAWLNTRTREALFDEQSAPGTAANQGAVYAKESGSTTCLYFRMESNGSEIKITDENGRLNLHAASTTLAGAIEIATDAEAVAVSATDRAVTPGNLAAVFAAPPAVGSGTPGVVHTSHLRPSATTKTLSGTEALAAGCAPIQFLDPGGAARIVKLPPETNTVIVIVNTADAAETLTVKDDSGSTTIDTIEQGFSKTFASDGTSWGVVGKGGLNDGDVTQAKLATSTSEVSSILATRATITGGSYCLQNNCKMAKTASASYIALSGFNTGSFTGWTSYRNEIYIQGTGTVDYMYMQSRYFTSSGEVPWVFILRNKSTGEIISTSNAVDHVCFGAGGNPVRLPHPWTSSVRTEGSRNWFFDGKGEVEVEILCINPDKDDYYTILYDCIQKEQGFAGLVFGQEIDVWDDKTGKFQKEPAYNLSIAREGVKSYPTAAVTVGLPIEVDLDPYSFLGENVKPVKKTIPQPANVIVAELI
jgi:hypothetical protein